MPCAFKTSEENGFIPGCVASQAHSIGTERVVSHHNKLKSIQRASLSNETVNDRLIISVMVLVLRATIPDQLLLLSCRKRIAAIKSHRLMCHRESISFENFLELTRVYNFSIRPRHCSVHTDNIVCVVIYHVSEVLKICSQ